MSKSKKPTPASLIWFEIPADKPDRAKMFYAKLFGWKINPFPGMPDYQHIDTGGAEASPDGGMIKRMHPAHTITHIHPRAIRDQAHGQGQETRRQHLQTQDRCAGHGLFCHLPGYGE